MNVATLRVEMRFRDCASVREKQRCLDAMVVKLRRHFNVSIAEVGYFDRPAETLLGGVAVGCTRREAREILVRVADAIGAHPRAEVIGHAICEV